MTQNTQTPRLVSPKKWSLLGTATVAGLATALGGGGLSVQASDTASPVQVAAGTVEAGEAGEGAVETEDQVVEFLVHLGFFEATHRIVAALYAGGHADMARAHLEASHHAYYDDIEGGLANLKQLGFEAEAAAFAKAVEEGASAGAVAAAADTVLAAIAAVNDNPAIDAAARFEALRLLMDTAAADFEAGTEAGLVTEPQEYRDAWGFYETARVQALALSGATDPGVADTAKGITNALAPVADLFPALVSDKAGADPSVIHAAVAWIEFAILRHQK